MEINEYLHRLGQKLSSLPMQERQDALEYYENYLSDADDPNTAMASLGTPGEVAADILADYMARATHQPATSFRERRRSAKVAWAFVIGIFALPVGLPLIIATAAVLFALFVTLGALIFSVFIAGVAVVATGIASLVSSPFILMQNTSAGLMALGYGLVSLGFGLLAFKLGSVLFSGFTLIGRGASAKLLKRRNING